MIKFQVASLTLYMNPELPKEMIQQIEEVNQLGFDQLLEDILPFVK
ncbi:hypothetical protein P7D85_02390 [Enterococcus hulanensis]|uniref:Uncharacterized protein n=1 Tax=Enterococcus hulanensis TaxID=2559929 RepID=A0ABU3EUS6_9ENTE|nr:hypothetical protein [Enterococcus hulanensis]MDT2598604.1 hypothetical protein [Enterococcus hulanensis]MDT2607891.1 hypothetical protein [Enterococcus hulanensis]MDT2615186.1 hypothetical protein [Enterococcus hulanensis]MDT2626843.1 hypothetical protein [Enterococcus hulanensis]MDT2654258.1 hypothetical protein [Enterococcus hulanensis]